MLIPVPCPEGETSSWIMIELQGEVERKDGGSLDDQFDIGTLSLSSTNAITLTVGYHQLEGKRVPLKKPFAILEKCIGDDGTAAAYTVKGVVREKYLFNQRPRPLISKPMR